MTTYYLNGNLLPENADFTVNGFTYPYSWLEGTTPKLRASFGIEKHGDVDFDDVYYWAPGIPKSLNDVEEVDVDGNPIYLSVWDPTADNGKGATVLTEQRMISKGLKTVFTEQIRNRTNTLLQPTDHYILRHAIEELEIPTVISTYRAAVIAEQNRVIPVIAATTTVEELVNVMSSIEWPKAD
jgi:hypothetical protein